jgi:hypothetical protein
MVAYQSRNRRTRTSYGTSPALMAIGILGVIAAAVVTIFLISVGQRVEEAPPAAAQDDPFADLPPDLPPGHAPKSKGVLEKVNPFADVASPTDDPLWVEAKKKGTMGMDMVLEAVRALRAGDRETARSKGQKAQELITEAVHATTEWEQELVEKFGESHSAVKRVQKTTSEWRRELMALKKNANI